MGDNERLCAMEPHLGLKRSWPKENARSAGQPLTNLAARATAIKGFFKQNVGDK